MVVDELIHHPPSLQVWPKSQVALRELTVFHGVKLTAVHTSSWLEAKTGTIVSNEPRAVRTGAALHHRLHDPMVHASRVTVFGRKFQNQHITLCREVCSSVIVKRNAEILAPSLRAYETLTPASSCHIDILSQLLLIGMRHHVCIPAVHFFSSVRSR